MSRLLLSLLLAASAPGPVAAQPSPPPPDSSSEPIVVEGRRNPKRIVDDFVRRLTPVAVGGQIARFEDPVCPVALGLPPGENKLVQDRLREVAAAVGMKVAPARCVPNLYVLVGRNKKEVIAGLERKFPHMLAGVSRDDMRELAGIPGPVASWQVVDRIGADGQPLSVGRMSSDGSPVRIVRVIGSPSRLRELSTVKFVASIMVVEAHALDGMTTRQLADYAAMRTFAATDPASQASLPAKSILSLFRAGSAPADAPPSVTWWDYAFLKSLYATSNDLSVSRKRDVMERIVAQELAKVPPEER